MKSMGMYGSLSLLFVMKVMMVLTFLWTTLISLQLVISLIVMLPSNHKEKKNKRFETNVLFEIYLSKK